MAKVKVRYRDYAGARSISDLQLEDVQGVTIEEGILIIRMSNTEGYFIPIDVVLNVKYE